jgi:UPF0755 protein
MKKALIWIAVALGALLLAVAGGVAAQQYIDRKLPNFTERFEFYVRPGTDPETVQEYLLASGKVRRPKSLKRALKGQGAMDEMKIGHYTVDPSASSVYLARMLRLGWQTPVRLTLSGSIRTKGVLARKIGSQMLADSAEVASFLFSPDSLARFGTDTTQLFCMIIPDTYQVYWTASVSDLFVVFRKAYNDYWTPERLRKAEAQGLTRDEVSVLASIVDGESHYEPEQPRIAGVYLNRLRRGMLLQADPTVAYCFGYSLTRILTRHLEVDSPYNTYKYAGLPPGPISCPPKNCLEAVLNAERHDYLFFCADPSFNGSHRFASSYSDHLANARAFQRALTERQKTQS